MCAVVKQGHTKEERKEERKREGEEYEEKKETGHAKQPSKYGEERSKEAMRKRDAMRRTNKAHEAAFVRTLPFRHHWLEVRRDKERETRQEGLYCAALCCALLCSTELT